jgi:Protein of unknown function (DUF2442)
MDSKTFDDQYEKARKAAEIADATEPRARIAHYDPETGLMTIHLRNGEAFSFSPTLLPELASASGKNLAEVKITPSGDGLYWPKLDVDLGLSSLMQIVSDPPAGEAQGISTLLDQLCAQIELAWVNRGGIKVVDTLAAEHPECAEDLYDFFSLLVETELGREPGQEELAESVRRTNDWLEHEGYDLAVRIAREEYPETTTTTTERPGVAQAAGNRAQTGDAVSGAEQALGLMGLIQDRTHKDPNDIIDEMGVPDNVLQFAQRYPSYTPDGARREIVREAVKRYPISEDEGYSAINRNLRRAALRTRSFSQRVPDYVEMIKKSRMSKEEKKRWLSFASEEAG